VRAARASFCIACRSKAHRVPCSVGVLASCGVDRPAFRAFVAAVRSAHRDNSFHNFWRASALVHATSCLLCAGEARALLADEDALTLLLAGAPGARLCCASAAHASAVLRWRRSTRFRPVCLLVDRSVLRSALPRL